MKRFAILALLAASALFGVAHAQPFVPNNTPIPVPFLPNTTQQDAIQDVPRGVPQAGNQYVTIGQIAGAPSYTFNVPVTGFALTFANNQDWFVLNPAGTLAAGTITFAPNPSDAQRECVVSSQAVSTATFTANSGQTVVGAPTALAAGTSVCFVYVAPVATWFRA
jgi:hypothetical protein